MIIPIQIIVFIKLILLFMSILNIVKEAFRLYKSLAKKEDFDFSKSGLTILGLSISYILALIFI